MATSSGWDSYIWQIQNKWSNKQQKYLITNCSQHAAIIGIDGSVWAQSAEWPGLHNYDYDLEQDDGSAPVKVQVNEFMSAMKATDGNRMPTAAGIRLGNQKFMLTRHIEENKVAYLSRQGGGGACIAKTKNAIVIGIWDKNVIMSNN